MPYYFTVSIEQYQMFARMMYVVGALWVARRAYHTRLARSSS